MQFALHQILSGEVRQKLAFQCIVSVSEDVSTDTCKIKQNVVHCPESMSSTDVSSKISLQNIERAVSTPPPFVSSLPPEQLAH